MKTLFLITMLTVSVFAQNAASQKAGKVTNPGVTAAFVYCNSGDSNCETANRVRNDSTSPYQNGVNGVTAVFNVISGSQDLTIGLNQTRRSAIFDLRVNTGGGIAGLWTNTPQLIQPYFNVLGAYNAKLQCGTAATCDNTIITDMNAGGWKVSGSNISYAMLWHPGTTRPVNSPDPPVRVSVHYVKDSNGEVYTITPIPNTAGLSIAGLEATSGRTVSAAGQYNMPFTLTVRPL